MKANILNVAYAELKKSFSNGTGINKKPTSVYS